MTLGSLIRCAERETRLRREFYPRRVEWGKMTEEQMDHEIACMEQIASTLRSMAVSQGVPLAPHDPPKQVGQV